MRSNFFSRNVRNSYFKKNHQLFLRAGQIRSIGSGTHPWAGRERRVLLHYLRGNSPDKITTKRVLIDGKETGIDHLDWIFTEVARLRVDDDTVLTEEILKRVKQFNYVPTKKTAEYGTGLLAGYKKFLAETR